MKNGILAAVAVLGALLLGLFAVSLFRNGQPGEFLNAAPVHGTSFLLSFEPGQAGAPSNLVVALAEAERNRFAKLGVRIYWQAPGSNTIRIVAALSGSNRLERARGLVSRPGRLEFRLVHPESDELILTDQRDADHEVMPSKHFSKSGKEVPAFLIQRIPVMTGEHITIAGVSHDQIGRPEVSISFDAEGTGKFAGVTGSNLMRQLAIVLDGSLISAPVILDRITSGHVEISGHFTEAEARDWADILERPLPVPVKIVETTSF